MIRTIATEIGGERWYDRAFLLNLSEVHKEEGICGLFAGLIPQLVGEMCVMWSIAFVMHGIDRVWASMVEPSPPVGEQV